MPDVPRGVMHLSLLAATSVALLSFPVTAQSSPGGLGDVPPDLSVHRVLNASKDSSFDWQGQRGKVVILEFFGTWCGPCVAGLPKINEFVRSLDPERFSWWLLADQKVETLREFMKDHEIVPPVLIDEESKTTEAFSPGQYPLAVVIGPDGRIAGRLHPALLSAERLEQVLDGRRIESPYVPPEVVPDLRWDESVDTKGSVAQVLLRKSDARRSKTLLDRDQGRIVGDGMGLDALVGLAFDAEPMHVDLSGFESKQRYRVSVKAADGRIDTARSMLRQFLETSFAAESEATTIDEERIVLERIPGSEKLPPHGESRNGGGTWNDEGVVDMVGVEMPFLARLVAMQEFGATNAKGLDLTGLQGQYRIECRYERGDADSLLTALEPLGLRFEKRTVERRKVRFAKVPSNPR